MSLLYVKDLEALEVVSDLYLAGHTNDGAEYTAEAYLIEATLPNGTRYRYDVSYAGCAVTDGLDGMFFEDIRPAAKEKAEKLLQRMKDRGVLDLRFWHEARPMYGSPAYEAEIAEMTDEERAYN